MPYETEVLEDALPDTTLFNAILVTDKDSVGENLNISCLPQSQNPNACTKYEISFLFFLSVKCFLKRLHILRSNEFQLKFSRIYRFSIEVMESNQDELRAAVVLRDKLDYNEQMIYHIILSATVSDEHM